MKQIKHGIRIIILIIIIEFGITQLDIWQVKLSNDINKNTVFTLEEMRLENCEQYEEGYICQGVAVLSIQAKEMRICCLKTEIKSAPEVKNIVLEYKNDTGVVSRTSLEVNHGVARCILNKQAVADLRIEIVADEKTYLKSIECTINPSEFHFSLSRVIAIIFIYLCGAALIGLQKMPDYSMYIKKAKTTEGLIREK